MLKLSVMAPATRTRPEVELLVCCARTCVDEERTEQIRALLREDIDWSYLIKIALRHGIMPLLYWNLNTICPEAVPKAILSQLRDYFHNLAQRNLFLTGELVNILLLLESHQITAVPLKGPVLAASAYGNLAFRQFYDLDILVHERDVRKAKGLLILEGYQPNIHLTEPEEEDSLFQWCDYGFVHNEKGTLVELHWRFTPNYFPFTPESDRLWEHLESVSLAGTSVLNLSPEDLLLYLCVHGCKHVWQRLAWIADIAELLRHSQLEWRRVTQQATRLGSKRMLLLGILLASDLLGTVLPEEVLQMVQEDAVVKWLAAQVRNQLFREADVTPSGYESSLWSIFNALLRLRMRERLQDQFPYYLHIARFAITPNQKDRSFLLLPAKLSFLYYLVRLLRLAREYGLKPLKHRLGL